MEYNLEKIGKRLRSERKKAGFKSQDKLSEEIAEYVGIYDRQRIAKWEKGIELPPMEVLCILCNLYNCDIGYLLCEYDCKTRPVEDISEKTGLSYDSVENILKLNKRDIQSLNLLLEDDKFRTVLSYISQYQDSLTTDRIQLLENFRNAALTMIPEITGKEKLTPESAMKREIADLQLQLANMSPDALEFQVNNTFSDVIEDIKNETESK